MKIYSNNYAEDNNDSLANIPLYDQPLNPAHLDLHSAETDEKTICIPYAITNPLLSAGIPYAMVTDACLIMDLETGCVTMSCNIIPFDSPEDQWEDILDVELTEEERGNDSGVAYWGEIEI